MFVGGVFFRFFVLFFNMIQFMRLQEQYVLQSKSINIRQTERKRLVNRKTTDYKAGIFLINKMGYCFSIFSLYTAKRKLNVVHVIA